MNLRSIGIAGIILGSLFKVQHWPGANVIALAGALLTITAVIIALTTQPFSLSRGLRSLAGVLLVATVVLKMQHWPGAEVAFCGAIATAFAVLIMDREQLDPRRLFSTQLSWLLLGSLTLTLGGILFKLMHWPGASIQLVLGLTGCAAWFLVTGSRTVRTV